LFSIDVEGLDLSGLSLLGLSACETALGRIDAADNLRGLTASALAAGTSAVVSTLWPTRDQTAQFFFSQLYAALSAGHDRRHAFGAAQRQTREVFPLTADWGAFYLSGAP
jgi:CHAT domain-containing protein